MCSGFPSPNSLGTTFKFLYITLHEYLNLRGKKPQNLETFKALIGYFSFECVCSMYEDTCKCMFIKVWLHVSVYIWQPEAVASLPWGLLCPLSIGITGRPPYPPFFVERILNSSPQAGVGQAL